MRKYSSLTPCTYLRIPSIIQTIARGVELINSKIGMVQVMIPMLKLVVLCLMIWPKLFFLDYNPSHSVVLSTLKQWCEFLFIFLWELWRDENIFFSTLSNLNFSTDLSLLRVVVKKRMLCQQYPEGYKQSYEHKMYWNYCINNTEKSIDITKSKDIFH